MVDENSDLETLAADSGGGDASPAPAKAKTGLLWLFSLLTLLLSAAAAYGVYYLWQQQQEQQTQSSSQQSLLSETDTAIVDLRSDLKSLDSELDAQLSKVAKERNAAQKKTGDSIKLLEKASAKQQRYLQSITSSNRDEWLLAETEYLLRLANQRILMSKEPSAALALLESADKVLSGIEDVALHKVRAAINKDITALRSAEQIDVDGTYLKLASLTAQIDALKAYEIPEYDQLNNEEPIGDTNPTPAEVDWKARAATALGSMKDALGKAFVIRFEDESIEAMLPPQQELYLRQNLRLMLEQAQLALLARKPAVYENSLDKAQAWVTQYFVADSSVTKATSAMLAELRKLDVNPALPDISASYRTLKAYEKSITSFRAQMNSNANQAAPAKRTVKPIVKKAPKPVAKPVPKATPKPAPKAAAQPAPQVAPKPAVKAAPKADPKSAAIPAAKATPAPAPTAPKPAPSADKKASTPPVPASTAQEG